MERASAALARSKYFECERLAAEALELAHAGHDYDRMSRILLPLQEARRNRRLAALDLGRVTVVEQMPAEGEPIKPGCYLIQPPLVGADGRELRERALATDVPVVVVVREPKTRAGLWPVVMIGPVTVRARVKPPAKETKIELPWFVAAGEALGDAAIDEVDPEIPVVERVAALLDRLNTVVDHEKLHQRLMDACHEAASGEHNGSHKPGHSRHEDESDADEGADGSDVADEDAAEVEEETPRQRRKQSRRAS